MFTHHHEVSRSNFAVSFGLMQKTNVPVCAISCVVISVILLLAVLIQYQSFDRHTDRQTHYDSIYRASIALHGKNTEIKLYNRNSS